MSNISVRFRVAPWLTVHALPSEHDAARAARPICVQL